MIKRFPFFMQLNIKDCGPASLQIISRYYGKYFDLDEISLQDPEEERETLTNMVNKSQLKIDEYLDEKSKYELEIKNFEVEVGPLKYISALVYGDKALDYLDKAVRAVILILVFVFDPLAVLLVVAANISINDYNNKRRLERLRKFKKETKDKIFVKKEPVGDGTAQKVTKTKNGVTMEYYE